MITERHSSSLIYYIVIAVVATLLYVPFLGGMHLFDWDEINFAESAREMIVTGDYLTVRINYEPFWEKPPLFMWMQVASMKAFGINEFAARFPNAVCGIITLLFIFYAGEKLYSRKFGLYWVIAYAGSVLPFLYFKSGIIDPWFNLFIFTGLYFFVLFVNAPKASYVHLVLSAFLTGLAILTKGPVAFLILILTVGVYFIMNKYKLRIKLKDVVTYGIVLSLTGGFWFILQIVHGNYTVIVDFINYQIRLFQTGDAGHSGFLMYHFVVLFFGVFPASVIALPAFVKLGAESYFHYDFRRWMLLLFWVVLILFTIVKTKIVHYSSLCYFPLTFLAAFSVYHAMVFKNPWKLITLILIAVIGGLFSLVSILVVFVDSFKGFIINRGIELDVFTMDSLMADGGWKGYELIAGIVLLAGIVLFVKQWWKNAARKVRGK